ncbi:MAG: response regulator [SAR324 cluster bacterium]|nr:response regulator [SAR324 cluster bacterium]
MRLLLVDDEPGLLEELEKGLVRRKHTVEKAANGEEAWEKYTDFPNIFDVVITDIKMPGMDGMTLLQKINEYDQEAIVIIMTGHGDLQMSIDALKLGAFSYFVKPFDPKKLYATIKKLESEQLSKMMQLECIGPLVQKVEFTIPGHGKFIPYAMFYIEKSFKWLWQLMEMNAPRVHSCLYEALTNAVMHGSLEIPTSLSYSSSEYKKLLKEREAAPEFSNRKIYICGRFSEKSFECVITDEGPGFEVGNLPGIDDPETLLSDGKGLQIIRYYMDEVNWNDKGNSIKITKYSKYFGMYTDSESTIID